MVASLKLVVESRKRDANLAIARCSIGRRHSAKAASSHGTALARSSEQRGRAATSEAFPFSRPRWFNRGSRCTDISKGRMTRIRIEPWTPRNDPVAAAVGGALAVAAALAAGLGSRVAPPVFGAVLALALAADWGLSALAEPEATYRARGVSLGRWLLAGGWLSFGVLLLHTPLAYPDPMRVLITALILGGSASRILDRYARGDRLAAPGLAIVLFWA